MCPITKTQIEKRKKTLGSSDVAAVLGVNPYCSAYDIWLTKLGRLIPQTETEAMKLGNMFERGVLKRAESDLGPLVRNQRRRVTGYPLVCNIDAIVKATGEPVEAKTAKINSWTDEFWGEAGTDQIPKRHIIQCTCHLLATEQKICWVPAVVGDGKGYRLYRVEFNKDLADIVLNAVKQFWMCVEDATAPPDSFPTLAAVRRVIRSEGKQVAVPGDLIEQAKAARKAVAEAITAKEQAEGKLLAALGDAEVGLGGEVGNCTYNEQHRKGYTVSDTSYRVLRFQKGSKDAADTRRFRWLDLAVEQRGPPRQKWYFTWGFNQGHDNCYTVIEAESYGAAREEMFSRWGKKWGFQYDSAEAAGVDEFNLKRIQ